MTEPDPSDSSGSAPLRVVGIEVVPKARIDDVIALGDKHRNTLGHLPFAGYNQSAQRGHIVVALDATTDSESPTLAGYCLYDPTVRADRYARIVHLCVADEFRGRGVTHQLLALVRERCSDRLGLRLRCRDDWEASKAWPSLGFEPVRQLVGRSKKGSVLTEWWSPNETTHLFSLPADDPDQLLVAVDSNVFCDLYGTSTTRRQRFSASVAVLAGSQQIRLARPFSLTTELHQTPDDRDRQLLLQAAAVNSLAVLNGEKSKVKTIRDAFLAAIPASALIKDSSLAVDAQLLAESIAGGADVFVTRDANAVTYLGPPASENHNVVVIDPVELFGHLEQRADAANYLPVQLQQTDYQVSRGDAASWHAEHLVHLLDNDGGERKTDFRQLVKDVAVEVSSDHGAARQVMLTPSGKVLAIWATRTIGRVLEVPLFRVNRGELLPTITRQIALALRRYAAAADLHTVAIQDAHSSKDVLDVLRRDGFKTVPYASHLQATALRVVSAWSDVQNAAKTAEAVDPTTSWADATPLRAEAAEYERVWWPAKITDADLPTFIVPIRGVFADDLLGHMPTLVSRDADLGLSREHVYYRSGRTQLDDPGRILWYSSTRDRQVVACSRLVESIVGSPEALHRAFAHLGVWSLSQVRASADKRGRVNALRFADTEIFTRPVALARVRELTGHTARLTIQSPVEVDGQQFAHIYEEGFRT